MGQATLLTVEAAQGVRDELQQTVEQALGGKVDKAAGKSLLADAQIIKLAALPDNAALQQSLNSKVAVEPGKSLTPDELLIKLTALPDAAALAGTLALYTTLANLQANYSTTAQVNAAIQAATNALIAGAPGLLDTFAEISAALGNDPNFAATILNSLAGKVDKVAGKSLVSDTDIAKLQALPTSAALTTSLAGKVNSADVVNTTAETGTGKVLDARQGKVLNDLITALKGGSNETIAGLKASLDALTAIVTSTAPDGDSFVNTIQELLSIFATYPEGVSVVDALAGKVSITDKASQVEAEAGSSNNKWMTPLASKQLFDANFSVTSVRAKLAVAVGLTLAIADNVSIAGTLGVTGAVSFSKQLALSNTLNTSSFSAAGLSGARLFFSGYTNDDPGATSTQANIAAAYFGKPTFRAVNNQTYTNTYSVAIEGAPNISAAAGGTITNTNAYAFGVLSGNSYFGGELILGSNSIRSTTNDLNLLFATSAKAFRAIRANSYTDNVNSIFFQIGESTTESGWFTANAGNSFSRLGISARNTTITDLFYDSAVSVPSALLKLESTTRGFLGPNMTQAQRSAISSPAQGLKVYQTDGGTAEGDWVYRTGAWWQNLVVNSSGATQGGLTVSGALGVTGNITPSAHTVYSLGASNAKFNTVWTFAVKSAGDNLRFSTAQDAAQFAGATGNFILQNGGTFVDNGAGFQVNHTISAASALARGMTVTPTLNASANNDVLIGLDINPTFNNGAYTGVTQYALRIQNSVFMSAGNLDLSSGTPIRQASGFVLQPGTNSLLRPFNAARYDFALNNSTPVISVQTSGNVSVGTTTDVASSILTLSSTTKGFLPTRMGTAQKNAISSPATGLVVFDTDLGKLCVYSDGWQTLTSA